MDQVTAGLEFTAAYLDDLIIYSTTREEHVDYLRQIFTRLHEASLNVKPKKCQLGTNQCIYLGHIVRNGRVQPEQSKIEAVAAFPKPRTKKQVSVFLGLSGYYRRFIA